MMAIARPLLLLTQVIRRGTGVISHVCHRPVSLSSREVSPLTIKQARDLLMDMVGSLYNTGEATTTNGVDLLPIKKNQEECPVRHMMDSYQEVIIPLGQDPVVREKYISFLKGLRFGRILEDLDTFAVWICYIHNQDPSQGNMMKSPLLTVTALVDRIDLHGMTLSPFEDVRMCGHVTWVGKSSMEVTMTLKQDVDGKMQQMLTARFVMVARNPQTKKAAVVNPLKPFDDKEWALFHLGERNRKLRQEEAQKSLLKAAPNETERSIIHDIFLQTIDEKSGTFNIRMKPEKSIWMGDAKLKNLRICHPEARAITVYHLIKHLLYISCVSAFTKQRNLYNKVFGGFLMQQAFELAWANAALYCKSRPVIQVVDDIVFRKPVEIGSLLFFCSQIVYTEGALMQVKVHAEVVDILSGSRDTTNDFYFIFDSCQPDLPCVVPRTYAESMLYLDGKRHLTK